MHYQPRPVQRQNDLAVVALVLAGASAAILFVGAPLTFGVSMVLSGPLGLAGLICGVIARQKARDGEAGGLSLAQAAVVISIVSLVLHVLAVIAGVILIVLAIDWLNDFDIPDQDPELNPDPALAFPAMSNALLDLRLLLLPLRGE